MRKSAAIFLLISAVILPADRFPAWAEMASSQYAIPSLSVTAGGSASLESAKYHLVDLKGQGVIGSMSSESYGLGLGGIYGELGPAAVTAPGVPYGTVPLFISRSGTNVVVTWEAAYVNPEIYVLSGDGQGRYTNVAGGWTRISRAGRLESPLPSEWDFDYFAGSRQLINNGEVGGGAPEVYYKGLQAGITTSTIDPTPGPTFGRNCFAAAWGVGKVNLTIAGGKRWTLFSMPFLNSPTDVNEILAGQVDYSAGADAITSVRVFSHENGGWNRASYFNGTSWQAVPGLNAAIYDGNKGLYVLTRAADTDKPVTIVGQIKQLDASTAYTIRSNWNVVGLPYPVLMDINRLSLNAGVKSDNLDLADRVYGHKNFGFNTCSYLKADGTWAPLPGLEGFSAVNAKPLYYLSKSSGDKPWELNPGSKGYN
jgi:hypothetical protein